MSDTNRSRFTPTEREEHAIIGRNLPKLVLVFLAARALSDALDVMQRVGFEYVLRGDSVQPTYDAAKAAVDTARDDLKKALKAIGEIPFPTSELTSETAAPTCTNTTANITGRNDHTDPSLT